jgi:ankyrin repeat protein
MKNILNAIKQDSPSLDTLKAQLESLLCAKYLTTASLKTLLPLLINKGFDVTDIYRYAPSSCTPAYKISLTVIEETLADPTIKFSSANKGTNDLLRHLIINDGNTINRSIIVKKLIDAGVNINLLNDKGESLLYEAAMVWALDGFRILINAGADVNLLHKKKWHEILKNSMFLNVAVSNNYSDIVRVLIDKGAKINAQDDKGSTLLHIAALNGSQDVVKLLTAKGALLDTQDDKRDTPLHKAIINKNQEIAQMLIQLGANTNLTNDDGKNPYELAYENGWIDERPGSTIAAQFHYKAKKNAIVKSNSTLDKRLPDIPEEECVVKQYTSSALTTGIAEKKKFSDFQNLWYDKDSTEESLKITLHSLITHGFSLNQLYCFSTFSRDSDYFAKNFGVVIKILADDNIKFHAAHNDINAFFISFLVNYYTIHLKDIHSSSCGDTLIDEVNGKAIVLKCIESLKETESGVNLLDDEKTTPLASAVKTQRLDIIQILIDAGADVDLKTHYVDDLKTPLILAIESFYSDEIVELLLKNNANPNITNEKGNTPLILAIKQCNSAKMVKLLLKNNANPNVKNAEGDIPLILAVTRGDVEIVRLLLQYEAAIDVTNEKGDTPLSLATDSGLEDIAAIISEKNAIVKSNSMLGKRLHDNIGEDFVVKQQKTSDESYKVIRDNDGYHDEVMPLGEHAKDLENTGLNDIS